MKFINRENELKEFYRLRLLSRKKLFAVALYGLRRIGKTRLLLEFLRGKGIYFFVNKNKTSKDLLTEYQHILRRKGVLKELEAVSSWDEFFKVLIVRNSLPVVFDEFQNFGFVEPAVFGVLQKNIDLNENKPGLLVFSGSLIGLMKNLFNDSKEPLYGRIKKGIKLEALSLNSSIGLRKELKLAKEDIIKLYCVFGGYPKYFVAVEDFGLQEKKAEEILDFLLFSKNAPLEDEVNSILSQEFGGRSSIYYSILKAIANGNNTISTIASALSTTPTSITRQIKELKDYFELIELEFPFEGKRGVYKIRHPLIQFWFSEIYKDYSDYVSRKPEFMDKLKKNLNTFYGAAFEGIARDFLIQKLELKEAMRQWGKIQGAEKGKNTYEIDLIAKNSKQFFVFEFKWKKLSEKSALKVLKEVEIKANYLQKKLLNQKFGLVAKKIEGKQKLRNKGFLVFDLNDF
ncbi:ATP-binding protein [Candidatus Micrarchaeota archaeon]|nr:ATP-binding protein [Candidatus Micrarchaeota archaeon]MBU2477404.1 ATP-binding protein [Candidatus Micrarchaeota archaeon]